jgi:hypothetical protein
MAEQLLAANNALLGTTNLLITGLPAGWRLLEGYAHPEVDEWTEYREVRWVSRGHGVYRLVEPDPGRPGMVRCEVEFSVSAVPATGHGGEGGGPVVCGHQSSVWPGTAKKGLLPPRNVPALTLEWVCSHTRRRLRVVLNLLPHGGTVADLERLLVSLTDGMRCH